MDISTQTYVYIVIFVITSVINLITTSIISGGYGFLLYLLIFAITLPFVLLFMYMLNCLTTGNCNILSWIILVLTSISMIITTIAMILASTSTTSTTSNTSTTST